MNEASKPDESAPAATIEQLAERFLDELRRGARPSISDYALRHPGLAPRIREVFPTLAMLERLSPAGESEGAREVSHPISQLGEYRIRREIGRGGMGVVYEAVHYTLGRRVALKVLPPRLASDQSLIERFHHEAKVAARLHHSNIVPVFDVGKHEGVHYYAMQFINGLGLDQVLIEIRRIRGADDDRSSVSPSLDRSPQFQSLLRNITGSLFSAEPSSVVGTENPPSLSPARLQPNGGADSKSHESDSSAVQSSTVRLPGETTLAAYSGASQHYFRSIARVGLQVAEALGYIHSQQLLHRDIKPSNLLLDTQGVVWVTDLGLARDEESEGLTRTGDIVGTVRYMAPERFHGQVQATSDLYSLGLTLYELLALRPAFNQADRSQLIHEITTADPPRLRSLDVRIPRDLETIVLKLIEREPERRYGTAQELAADLRSYLDDRPIKARQSGALERGWRWCRRNRMVASLVASVALLLLVLAVGGGMAAFVFRQQAERLSGQANELRREQSQSTRRLYDALVAQARSSRLSGQVGQRFDSLAALAEAAGLGPQLEWRESQKLDLRNEAIACMTLADVRLAQPAHRTPAGAGVLAFDAELARYVWSTDRGELRFFRTANHEEIFALPGPGVRAHVARFSPDGRLLAAKYHDTGPPAVKVWDLDSQTALWESAGDQFHFAPDSRRFVLGQLAPVAQIVDLREGREICQFPTHARPGGVRLHPREPRLAVSSLYSRDVQILDSGSGKVLATLSHPEPVFELNWNPSGNRLACACMDRRVYLWDAENGLEQIALAGHRAEAVQVMFDHAGDIVASHGWDNATRLWNPHSGRQLLSFDARPHGFDFDDRRLACTNSNWMSGDEARVLEFAPGHECRQLVERKTVTKGPYHLDVSHDGRLLLSTGPEGVTLWDLATRARLAFLAEPTENNGSYSSASFFAPSDDSFFTTGADGIRRWPIRHGGDPMNPRLIVGPPQTIFANGRVEKACLDRAGQTIAMVQDHQGHVMRLDRPDQPLRLTKHDAVAHIAVSPDGRWVATGTWHGRGVVVWDADTGQKIADLFPEASSAVVLMSSDGRRLAAGANEVCRIWEVGSWKLLHEFPAAYPYVMAFSPDGGTLALSQSRQAIRLLEATSGATLALLNLPDADMTNWARFTPDGGRLAVAHSDHVVQLWDLALIRKQLGEMGLDWPAPAYQLANDAPIVPFAVRVDFGSESTQ